MNMLLPKKSGFATCLAALLSLIAPEGFAHGTVTPFPKLVQDGIPLANLSSTTPDAQTVYRVEIPAGVSSFKVSTSGGKGDCDLYVRFGAHPDLEESVYDASSEGATNAESVTMANPQPGVWYVGLKAAEPYSGVRLSLVTTLVPGAIPLPRFTPGAGIFGGSAVISFRSPLAGATVLYSIDGNDPTLSAPSWVGLTINSDTTIRARLKTRSGALGPIATADYWVAPSSEIQTLQSGVPADHLCGSARSRRYFKIDARAGDTLTVQTEGGAGSSTIKVRFAAPPAVFPEVNTDVVLSSSGKVQIKGAKAGDYYILLEGRGNFYDRSITAITATEMPDLVAWAPSVFPYVTNESFDPGSCEVVEGMITAGAHRLLRFNTESRNLGGSDVVLPSPIDNPNFEYQECHGHYHFKGFAAYRLLDKDGNVAQIGKKVSFCLLDVYRWNSSAARNSKYTCDNQGIQAGWSDVYDSGLPGQWVEIDGLPAGNYQLEITINPARVLIEGDYGNNVTTVPVRIDAP